MLSSVDTLDMDVVVLYFGIVERRLGGPYALCRFIGWIQYSGHALYLCMIGWHVRASYVY